MKMSRLIATIDFATSQEPSKRHLSCFEQVLDNGVLGYSDLSKEAAAIKTQLFDLASRLDRIEHELQN